MSLRTRLIPLVERCRAITGSERLDQRPSRLTIRTRTWSGGRTGDGTATDSDLELPQHYKIKELSVREIASSGGRFEIGDLRVVVTTRDDYTDTGYATAQLAPEVSKGTEVIYLLSGQIEGEYSRIALTSDRPYRRELVLRSTRRTP